MTINKKLILGTAQFGMSYGNYPDIHAQNIEIIKSILEHGIANDIKHIDTAPSYGNFFDKKVRLDNFTVDTKVHFPNLVDLKSHFYSSIHKTLNSINVKKISTLYLHNPEIFTSSNQIDKVNLLFEEAKTLGLIEYSGISAYNICEIKDLLQRLEVDVIQLPINFIDGNFRNNITYLKKMKKKYGLKIYARSIFLQGVLLNLDRLPSCLSSYKKQLTQVQKWLCKYRLQPSSACISFVEHEDLIDKYIIGVQNLEEFKEILNTSIVRWPDTDSPTFHEANLLDPRLWE